MNPWIVAYLAVGWLTQVIATYAIRRDGSVSWWCFVSFLSFVAWPIVIGLTSLFHALDRGR